MSHQALIALMGPTTYSPYELVSNRACGPEPSLRCGNEKSWKPACRGTTQNRPRQPSKRQLAPDSMESVKLERDSNLNAIHPTAEPDYPCTGRLHRPHPAQASSGLLARCRFYGLRVQAENSTIKFIRMAWIARGSPSAIGPHFCRHGWLARRRKSRSSESAGRISSAGDILQRGQSQSDHSSVANSTAAKDGRGPRRWMTSTLQSPIIIPARALS